MIRRPGLFLLSKFNRNEMGLLNIRLLVIALAFQNCNEPGEELTNPQPTPPAGKPIEITKTGSVLFVGNSLTYSNDLPALVSNEALKRGIELKVRSITAANTAISDHWESGEVHKAMDEEHFDFVVIQQGPSSQVDGRVLLIEFGERYKALCDEKKSQLAFFMVWPARVNYQTFNGVIKNYTDAAALNKSLLCPVGRDWKDYMDMTKDFSYYGPDQFHPSPKGSQVAASIILATLYP
jgi:hypothetical protein